MDEVTKKRQRREAVLPPGLMHRALSYDLRVSHAITELLQAGVTLANISRVVGSSTWEVRAWKKGHYTPRILLQAVTLVEWADDVRVNGVTWKDERARKEKNK